MNYETKERIIFNRELEVIESAPLHERREAREALTFYLNEHPAVVTERIGWLLNGSYGAGAAMAAENILNSRANKRAWLLQTIAILEWHCPRRFAGQVWNKLTADQQDKINAMIDAEIANYQEEYNNG